MLFLYEQTFTGYFLAFSHGRVNHQWSQTVTPLSNGWRKQKERGECAIEIGIWKMEFCELTLGWKNFDPSCSLYIGFCFSICLVGFLFRSFFSFCYWKKPNNPSQNILKGGRQLVKKSSVCVKRLFLLIQQLRMSVTKTKVPTQE